MQHVLILEQLTLLHMAQFNDIIYTRRSIRRFVDCVIESEKIEKLLKAALLAPSGKRMYPCDFIIVDDAIVLGNLSKAKTHGAALIKNAPLAIVIVADTSKYDIWVEDASIAATYIMLEAEDQGLGCCWVQMRLRGTEDGQSATENMQAELGLPEGFEILSVLALGYRNEDKTAYTDQDLKYGKVHHNKYTKSKSI